MFGQVGCGRETGPCVVGDRDRVDVGRGERRVGARGDSVCGRNRAENPRSGSYAVRSNHPRNGLGRAS